MGDHNLSQHEILAEKGDAQSFCVTEVDQWKKKSILKIRQIAEDQREKLSIIHKYREGRSL